jgi:hypothetical protein
VKAGLPERFAESAIISIAGLGMRLKPAFLRMFSNSRHRLNWLSPSTAELTQYAITQGIVAIGASNHAWKTARTAMNGYPSP